MPCPSPHHCHHPQRRSCQQPRRPPRLPLRCPRRPRHSCREAAVAAPPLVWCRRRNREGLTCDKSRRATGVHNQPAGFLTARRPRECHCRTSPARRARWATERRLIARCWVRFPQVVAAAGITRHQADIRLPPPRSKRTRPPHRTPRRISSRKWWRTGRAPAPAPREARPPRPRGRALAEATR